MSLCLNWTKPLFSCWRGLHNSSSKAKTHCCACSLLPVYFTSEDRYWVPPYQMVLSTVDSNPRPWDTRHYPMEHLLEACRIHNHVFTNYLTTCSRDIDSSYTIQWWTLKILEVFTDRDFASLSIYEDKSWTYRMQVAARSLFWYTKDPPWSRFRSGTHFSSTQLHHWNYNDEGKSDLPSPLRSGLLQDDRTQYKRAQGQNNRYYKSAWRTKTCLSNKSAVWKRHQDAVRALYDWTSRRDIVAFCGKKWGDQEYDDLFHCNAPDMYCIDETLHDNISIMREDWRWQNNQ